MGKVCLSVSQPTLLFVTGHLAETALREVLSELAPQAGFQFEIAVPGVQVAALLHTRLLQNRLQIPEHVAEIILPGWSQTDARTLTEHFGKPFRHGPKDLRDLPEFFVCGKRRQADLSGWSTQIIAELNHATRLTDHEVMRQAYSLQQSGADLIDIGCIPGESSPRAGQIATLLRAEGFRISIDSFDRREVTEAVQAGAELILSCNHDNFSWVTELQTEVVAIPDQPADLDSLRRLTAALQESGCRFRLDPILEPIGMGFTRSLQRYITIRDKYPDVPMMMGVGNVTELSEVDSAGINLLLAAVCEELGIQSILTTQVINWCRTAVAEFDVARRLVHYSLLAGTIPKHITADLVMLRDSRLHPASHESLQSLAAAVTDRNFRIFAEDGELHLLNRDGWSHAASAFDVFSAATTLAQQKSPRHPVTPEHAFYLGYELARAEVALLLGKQYVQDAPMTFGLLGEWRASSSVHQHPDPATSTLQDSADAEIPPDSPTDQ